MCRIHIFLFQFLLRIFKDVAHRSKTEFTLGPSSDVNLTSDTILFVDLPYTNIHASRSQESLMQVRVFNLTPEPDSTPIIALFNKQTPWSEASNFRQSHACPQIIFQTVKNGYLLVHIPATHHCRRLCNRMEGGEVSLCRKLI